MEIPAPIITAGISAGISAITSVVISLYSYRVKRWMTSPRLEVEYNHLIPGCRVDYNGERVYLRVRIRNNSKHSARECKAYLVGVELSSGQEILHDNPILEWPYRGATGIDIVRTIDQFLNIAASTKELSRKYTSHFRFPASFRTSEMLNFEKSASTCTLKIALLTDDGYRKDFSVEVIYGTSWDTLTAKNFRI
jgi:hypothetical protein